MKPLSILILLSIAFCGGSFDHGVNAFGHFKKPMAQIDNFDRAWALIDHAKTDAIVAENGKNLMLTQGLCTIIAYQKAKSVGYGPQFKEAMFYGNGFDILDKLLTGGAIQYQLQQVPVVGEYLALLFPAWTNTEIIHAIPGYPQPNYSMDETTYYWFQAIELALFWLELDGLKVKGNQVYLEVSL